jgi:P27 family predicted phage terminase small subunit
MKNSSEMAGRNPKPTALRELEGNRGHRPLNRKEPKPPSGVPRMPKWLSKPARKIWKETVPLLMEMKVLTMSDGEALGSYCEACVTLQKAQEEIALNGVVVAIYETGDDGKILKDEDGKRHLLDYKTNPAVTIADKAMKLKRALGSDFGLSPVSRAKLHTEPDGQQQDPMESFLRRKSSSAATQ